MGKHLPPAPVRGRFGAKAFVASLVLLWAPAGAQTVYYSNYSGDGTWGNGANWGDASTANVGVVPATSANLVFSDHVFTSSGGFQLSADQTVILGQNRTAASLQFDAPFNYTLQGNTLTLDNGASATSITVTNAGPTGGHTIQSALTLYSNLNITATANTALTLGGAITAGTHSFTVANNGTVTFGGAITGSGTFTQDGTSTGTTILAGNSSATYTGNLSVQNGTLQLGASNVLRAATTLTLSSGTATFDLADNNQTLGSITFTGGTVQTGAGTLTLAGGITTNASSAPATITGNLDLGSATRTFAIAAGTTTPDLLVSANLSGTGGITKTGAGELLLSGASTYSGANTLSAGTTIAGSNTALGTGTTSVSSGATLGLQGGITLNSGTITVLGTGVTGSGGAISNFADDNTLASTVALGGATQIGAAAGTVLTIAGNMSGAGTSTLAIGGTGVVELTGNNNFAGATTVNAGATLAAGSNNALGNSTSATTTTVTSGGTLALDNGATIGNENITVSGTGVGGLGALTAFSGNNTITNAVTLAADTTLGAADGATLTLTGGLTSSRARNLTKADDGTVVIAANANLNGGTTTITGGTLSLAGANGVILGTGAITVNAGTLQLDNTVANNSTRISGNVTLNDGSIEFIGNGGANSTGSMAVTAATGSNNIFISAGAGRRGDLTITNLVEQNNATVAFFDENGTLGSGALGSGRVFLTMVNGVTQGGNATVPVALPGWILVGSDFAEYTGSTAVGGNGVRAVTSYDSSGTGLNVNISSANVLLDNTSTSTEYTLTRGLATSATTDGNLKIADLDSGSGTSIATLTGNRTLTLSKGGILKTAGTNNVFESTITGATAKIQSGTTNLTVTTDAGTKLTIDPVIQNQGFNARGLLKAGDGTLVLTGTNTYTGINYLSNGTLQIAKQTNLGAATSDLTFSGSATLAVTGTFTTNTGKVITIANNVTGTFDVAGNQTLTIAGTTFAASAASILAKTNAGTLVIASANTSFAGSAIINGGTLELDASTSLGSARPITLNGGTLRLKNDYATSFSSPITVTADSAVFVDRATTGSNLMHTLGTLSIGSQTLTTTGANGFDLTFGAVTLTGDAVFNTSTAGDDLTLGAVSGTGSLTKSGAAILTLSTANTYSGPTTVSGGTLVVGKNGLPTATALTILAGATVLTNSNAATVTSLSGTGNAAFNLGTAALTVGDGTSTTYSGTITASALTKNGTGALTLDGASGNSIGTFKVNDGTLVAGKTSGSATGTGAVTVGDGIGSANSAVLRLSAPNQVNDTSAVTINFDGRLDLNGNNDAVATITGSGSINLGSGILSLLGNGSTTYSGAIGGTGGLVKSGTGTLTLSGSNTYSGPTTINQGTVSISSAAALGTGAGGVTIANGGGLNIQGGIAISGATLSLAGNGAAGTGALYSISGDNAWGRQLTLTGAATINVAANNLTLSGGLDTGGYAATFASTGNTLVNGAIIGAGSVTKTGSGVLVLGATGNSYSGATTISAGSLQFGTNNAGPSASAVNLAATGTALNLNNYSGAVGSLAGIDGSTVSLGSGPLTAGGDNSSTTLASAVTGTGGFTKVGTGTMTIAGSATNSLSGGFNVNDGAVILSKTAGLGLDATGTGALKIGDNSGAAGSASVKLGALNQINDGVAVTIGSDGKLDLNNNSERFASLTGTTGATVALGSGTLTVGASNASTTFNGSISGSGGLIKEGTGTLTLGGTSSFTGATTINGGTLALAASNAISSTGSLTISSGTGLTLAGNVSQTVAGLSSTATSSIALGANAVLTVNAGATTTLLGSLTGTGTLAYLNGGTLTLSSTLTFGTLVLGGTGTTTLQLGTYNLALDTLHITGSTILDFSGAGANRLTTTNLIIDPGAAVSVIGWVNLTDFFIAQNFSGATVDKRGTAPENQITFQGYTSADTKWSSFNHEITPAPEPETYGALLIGAAVGCIGFRRWRLRAVKQV